MRQYAAHTRARPGELPIDAAAALCDARGDPMAATAASTMSTGMRLFTASRCDHITMYHAGTSCGARVCEPQKAFKALSSRHPPRTTDSAHSDATTSVA